MQKSELACGIPRSGRYRPRSKKHGPVRATRHSAPSTIRSPQTISGWPWTASAEASVGEWTPEWTPKQLMGSEGR